LTLTPIPYATGAVILGRGDYDTILASRRHVLVNISSKYNTEATTKESCTSRYSLRVGEKLNMTEHLEGTRSDTWEVRATVNIEYSGTYVFILVNESSVHTRCEYKIALS
jgi:hypothetical protein